ncbi:bifunctional diguanylate cyclase/phosphodiesterase [Methylophilus sp. YYY-1]|jgi:diguanylate cyclase (GGDEF)-like protein/PAS domain S-box-containing protein|uniref:EAL domain-containing protein n=1 Tax=Methylophilus glucosoxydans TaxID=752553 RepID=A0ABW3GH38_9PROT|nr:bifunctional diguanylate cyclase/phosphodiesterase [Methylophilus sp. YYY-1]
MRGQINWDMMQTQIVDALMTSQQQRLLDTLLDNLDGMIYRCLYDDQWTMIYVSKGCESLTGYAPQDLILNKVKSYERITHTEDRAQARKIIHEAVSRKQRFALEYRIVRADGEISWVAERGSGVFDPEGKPVALEGIIQDITERKRIEQALYSTEQKYRSMFENSTLGMFQTTESGTYLNANLALAKLYGYASPAELISDLNNISTQLYVEDSRRHDFTEAIRLQGRVQNFESQVYRLNGETIWISENAHAVYDAQGSILYYEGTVEDITDRKNYELQIRQLAVTDNLTGLLNRHAFSGKLASLIAEADKFHYKIAIAFIDLDHFKLINDTLGHRAGDKLLENVAQRLIQSTRPTDAIVRFGGDEFVMLYPGMRSAEDAQPLLSRVMEAISQPIAIGDYVFNMTCSVGVSIYPDHAQDIDTLLTCADSALYSAKNAGKNKVQMFSGSLAQQLGERNEIEYGLGHALQRQELMLYYQPQINMQHGNISALEALIRWQHPERGLIPPDQFIPVAEETGHIFAIGEWVLQTACKKIKAMQTEWGYLVPIAVNVSPIQFLRGNLVETVQRVLRQERVPPHLITLEVTENARFKDEAMFTRTLEQLKRLGVCIAIDDFGIGYSNMAYLKNYPIDELKIDKAFVQDLEQSVTNGNILLALINLGKSLHKSVTAEGIENEYQHRFLLHSGCDVGQGYYYSKPLSDEALAQFMREQRPKFDHLQVSR